MTCTQQKGLKEIFMGVLKLSVIEEQNKQLKNRLRVVGQKGHIVRISNCYCPCVSSEKAKLQCATMLPLLEVGTLIKESLIKESHCLTLWLSLFYAYGSYSISNSKRKLLFV